MVCQQDAAVVDDDDDVNVCSNERCRQDEAEARDPGASSQASADAGSTDSGSPGPAPDPDVHELVWTETKGLQRPDASSTSTGNLEPTPDPDMHELVWTETKGLQRFEPLHVVGSGVYATVRVARDRETDERVALKSVALDPDQGEGGVPARVIREVSLLRDFVHPNIVQIKDLIIGATECQLVFEYVPGDLYQVLKGHRMEGTQLPMDKVLRYSQDLLDGIYACHLRLVIHRDLKPQNVLIHPVDGLKICDFGLARVVSSLPVESNYTREVITLWYRGPELLLGNPKYPKYGLPVDLWSSGCIVAEMATGYPTFPGDSEIGTIFKIMQLLGSPTETTWPGFEERLTQWIPSFPQWPPTDLKAISDKRPELGDAGMDLVRSLLAMRPEARLTSRRARAHALFSQPGPAQRTEAAPCSATGAAA